MSNDFHRILKIFLEEEASKTEELDRLFHLLEEMTGITDTFLIWVIKYCDEHKIPIWNEDQLTSYITMSRILLRQVREKTSNIKDIIKSRKLPSPFLDDTNPDKLPKPCSFLLSFNF